MKLIPKIPNFFPRFSSFQVRRRFTPEGTKAPATPTIYITLVGKKQFLIYSNITTKR